MPHLPHFGHIKNFYQKMGSNIFWALTFSQLKIKSNSEKKRKCVTDEFIGSFNTDKRLTKRQYIILKVTKSCCSQGNH